MSPCPVRFRWFPKVEMIRFERRNREFVFTFSYFFPSTSAMFTKRSSTLTHVNCQCFVSTNFNPMCLEIFSCLFVHIISLNDISSIKIPKTNNTCYMVFSISLFCVKDIQSGLNSGSIVLPYFLSCEQLYKLQADCMIKVIAPAHCICADNYMVLLAFWLLRTYISTIAGCFVLCSSHLLFETSSLLHLVLIVLYWCLICWNLLKPITTF